MKINNFGVESWLNKYETLAKYDLAQSSINALTIDDLYTIADIRPLDLFQEEQNTALDYGWIEGSDRFKSLVAKHYKNVSPDNVLQMNGATGANLIAMMAVVEPGDHVVSMLPTYQQLYDLPRALGANVDFVHLSPQKDWLFDIEQLENLVNPNTKLITLNNANNPTGRIIKTDLLQKIVEIARRVGAYVLVDEVYLPMDKELSFTSIADIYERGIATNSLSKSFSLPALRTGWIIAPDELMDKLRTLRDYTMISNGNILDRLSVIALEHSEQIMERNHQIVKDNLHVYTKWVQNEPNVSLIQPDHVPISFLQIHTGVSTEAFCLGLLKEKGVLLVPGEAFEQPGFVRLGYCCDSDVLKKGLSLISEYLNVLT